MNRNYRDAFTAGSVETAAAFEALKTCRPDSERAIMAARYARELFEQCVLVAKDAVKRDTNPRAPYRSCPEADAVVLALRGPFGRLPQ